MKEQVTKFDLEAAFKALNDLDVPKVKGIRANRMDLSEAVKRVDRTSILVEDYYDLSSSEDIADAKTERDGEVAKAKLARIEKIVDLDAESEEDILPSYVGKVIMQCPQCMTLFYKAPEDIEHSEEDPNVVNISEICQHCGNDTGYTLIGKVAEEVPEEPAVDEMSDTEEATAVEDTESTEENTDEATEETTESEEELSLEDIPDDTLETEESTEEEKEVKESLNNRLYENAEIFDCAYIDVSGSLEAIQDELTRKAEQLGATDINYFMLSNNTVEELLKDIDKNGYRHVIIFTNNDVLHDPKYSTLVKDSRITLNGVDAKAEEPLREDLDKDMQAFNAYVDYLKKKIDEEEKALNSANNELIKDAVQKRIDALKQDLDAALPEIVKELSDDSDNLPTPAEVDVAEEAEAAVEEDKEDVKEALTDKKELNELFNGGENKKTAKKVNKGSNNDTSKREVTPALNESPSELVFSDAAIDKMFNSKEFRTPISASEAEGYLGESVNNEEELEEFDEVTFDEAVNKYLTEVYANVENFNTTYCKMNDNNTLMTEGTIAFKSGKTKLTNFTFNKVKSGLMEGYNKDLSDSDTAFQLTYKVKNGNLMTEELSYRYTANQVDICGGSNK